MKKLFTIDDFMVAFISALGYGYGETIARLSGWSEIMCIVACFALGIALEELITVIVFSPGVQKSKANRIYVFAAILFVFLLAQFISIKWMGVSMLEYLEEEFLYVVGLPILGLIVNLLIRLYRVRKILKLYGDGSEGYVFDVTEEEIKEVNRQNQPIKGEYDITLAVKTRTGIYVGEKYKNTHVFMGIPYAKPPVGALRWKAAEPLDTSEEVFEAKKFGASAIQVEHKGSIVKNHRQSEDCLTLNIATGAKKEDTKKAVLVLFHHGDFTYGGSIDPLLQLGDYINAHQDIVLVTFNYRLGIFGFIDFSDIPGGEEYSDAINLGLLDQIAALKWIKENIASFGGDPEQITVMGFESGATCISLIASSTQAKGLFKRAVVINGSPDLSYDTREASKAFASSLLRETQTSNMSELLQLDTEILKKAAQKLWMNRCAPTCDGKLIPSNVYEAYKNGAASGIEFIVGVSSGELEVLKSAVGSKNFEDVINAAAEDLHKYMNGYIDETARAYIEAHKTAASELDAKSNLIEQWFMLGIYRLAAMLSQGANKVFYIFWDEEALIEKLGSGTADILATFFGNSEALQLYGSILNKDLSEALQTFLYKFVSGEDLQLYHNEISGHDEFEWKDFPQALIISDGKLTCKMI